MRRRHFLISALAFCPAAGFILSSCGAGSSLLPTLGPYTINLMSGQQTVTRLRVIHRPASRDAAGNLDPVATLEPSSFQQISTEIAHATIKNPDVNVQLDTNAPVTIGVVLTTTSPLSPSGFLSLIDNPAASGSSAVFSFNLPAPGKFYFGPTDPMLAGVTYGGSLTAPLTPAANKLTGLLVGSSPISVYVEAITSDPNANPVVNVDDTFRLVFSAQPKL